VVYTANWVIIYHLPPIKGTRNSFWTHDFKRHFLLGPDSAGQSWHAKSFRRNLQDSPGSVHLWGKEVFTTPPETNIALENRPLETTIFRGYVSCREDNTWYPKPIWFNGCFSWMIPNLYINIVVFTKYPLKIGCLGFQVHQCSSRIRLYVLRKSISLIQSYDMGMRLRVWQSHSSQRSGYLGASKKLHLVEI